MEKFLGTKCASFSYGLIFVYQHVGLTPINTMGGQYDPKGMSLKACILNHINRLV